jgi:hypothetical protein
MWININLTQCNILLATESNSTLKHSKCHYCTKGKVRSLLFAGILYEAFHMAVNFMGIQRERQITPKIKRRIECV